jgi:hypothetical protein
MEVVHAKEKKITAEEENEIYISAEGADGGSYLRAFDWDT